jgi:hypothetical protein
MKFLPTLNLYANGVQDAIRNGQLKLQTGQWLTCGNTNAKPCRYVSHTKHSINVVHWQGNSKDTNDLFLRRLNKGN